MGLLFHALPRKGKIADAINAARVLCQKGALFSPELVEKPGGKRFLVLAPHFDDEVLGCGGTIKKIISANGEVAVVYLTDGNAFPKDFNGKKSLVETRKEESRRAAEILGFSTLEFFDEPDGLFLPLRRNVERLSKIIDSFNPDTVFLPWPLDINPDHIAANRLLAESFKESKKDFLCCAFEISTPLIPNIIVDVSSVEKEKRLALQQFSSQLKALDIVSSALSLNAFRFSSNFKGKGFAEAFLSLKAKDYFSLPFFANGQK